MLRGAGKLLRPVGRDQQLLYTALAGALFFLPFNLMQVQGYSATAAADDGRPRRRRRRGHAAQVGQAAALTRMPSQCTAQ